MKSDCPSYYSLFFDPDQICKKGKFEQIKDLISKNSKIDINERGMWSNTPLIIACQYNHSEIALFLLEQSRIDIISMNQNGGTALLYACLEGLNLVVKKLLSMGCYPNSKPSLVYNSQTDKNDFLTPLSAAIVNGHFEIVQLLIQYGCSISFTISQKSEQTQIINNKKVINEITNISPLMLACKYQQKEIFEYLLSLPFTLQSTTNTIPIGQGLSSVTGSAHGTSLGQGSKPSSATGLGSSSSPSPSLSSSEKEEINFLQQDSNGSTILHYICTITKGNSTNQSIKNSNENFQTSLEILTTFITFLSNKSKKDLEIILFLRDNNQSLPIHNACESLAISLVEKLLNTEQQLNQSNQSNQSTKVKYQLLECFNDMGYTPLHIGIKKRSIELIELLLLKYNSNPFQKTNSKQTQSQINKNDGCAYDIAMKLNANNEIYKIFYNYNKNLETNNNNINLNQERVQEEAKESQDDIQGFNVLANPEVNNLSGHELRIEELVNSFTAASTPSIATKISSQAMEKNQLQEKIAISNTATLFMDQIFTSSNQNFLTPIKTKSTINNNTNVNNTNSSNLIQPLSLNYAPLKEKSKDSPLFLMKSDDTVRIASPIF